MSQDSVEIHAGEVVLKGDLVVPEGATSIAVFAHGTGSGRLSPRNRAVADALGRRGLSTLLMDLLTEEEERLDLRTAELRFDVGLLAERVIAAVDRMHAERPELAIGCFGASTGAAAALIAAAERPELVRAVVSRGGRPDLAGDALRQVQAPTLLIAGGADHVVIDLNRRAMEAMRAEAQLEIVPGATHLFEEPGALEEVSRLAGDWFSRRL